MGEPSELQGKSQAEDLCRLGSENRPLCLRVGAGGLTGSMGQHAFARYPWAGHPNKASASANFLSCLWPGMGAVPHRKSRHSCRHGLATLRPRTGHGSSPLPADVLEPPILLGLPVSRAAEDVQGQAGPFTGGV